MELDHIVHFLNRNPVEAISCLEQYGLKAVRGGSHRSWGTYNSLLYIGKSYIEFLAVENTEIASVCDNPLVRMLLKDTAKFEGLGQICFRTDDISRLREELLAKGYAPSTIFQGSRQREDGVTIRWKMLFLLKETPILYPFFIEWEQSDASRFRELKEKGYLTEGQENVSVKSIYFIVTNAVKWASDWSHLLGVSYENKQEQAVVKIGQIQIVFQQASSLELKKILKIKGERPYRIEFNPSIRGQEFLFLGDLYW